MNIRNENERVRYVETLLTHVREMKKKKTMS